MTEPATNQLFPSKMGCIPPAVPVRDMSGARLPLDVIRAFVMISLDHVRRQPDRMFYVMEDGWGYNRRQIAPMFDNCPKNIVLPYGFQF